jgi:MinD-like ATPase involved in chromosome partitioning or flagellar assembly
MQNIWQKDLKKHLSEFYIQSPKDWVDISFSTSGLLNVTIVSYRFLELNIPQRREQLQSLIDREKISISLGFMSLYTIQEADSLGLSSLSTNEQVPIYTWQDLAIQAANPQNQPQFPQREFRIPRTITFYSFKGGVGRTTALTHIAWILATRGRKIVAVDLDLEAPGLSTAFSLSPEPKYGLVDYFYERSYLPEETEPTISITDIFGEVKIPNAKGRLFVVPAGSLNLDYISKVDDLRANIILDSGESLWSVFCREIQEQLKPDLILVDSRTGINQWGALSLLQAADEGIIFLFPNEQNRQGIELLLKSLKSSGKLSLNFVFSPVPDTTEIGLQKVRNIWNLLREELDNSTDQEQTNESELELMDSQNDEIDDLLIIPYLTPIAVADTYPVSSLLDHYTKIVNLIDEDTDEIKRTSILTDLSRRWQVIESFKFSEVNAADPKQELSQIFQRTADFERFLDDTTCLIRGRKGTGKTALYLLLLKHPDVAKKLAHGRLDNVVCLSVHGSFDTSRPDRGEFQIINQNLEKIEGEWADFWRAYLLIRAFQAKHFIFPKGQKGSKFAVLREKIKSLSQNSWNSEHTQCLSDLSIEPNLRLLVRDALEIINQEAQNNNKIFWFLYDDLDQDFPETQSIRQKFLAGLFQLIQSCDGKGFKNIRFKVFLREDIWSRLIFDNKSHFNGRDILLQWTRLDFLRLALRQAIQSKEFKDLIDRFSPIATDAIDQTDEEAINRALELLWGNRRRKGNKAKYVSRWVYERLTDSSDTTFPRSLSILLKGAKEQELSYKGQFSIQSPTDDRLLRAKSLEVGLEKASKERCDAIREEYPNLKEFFDSLEGKTALLSKEDLQQLWQETAQEISTRFDEFAEFLNQIGLAKWREKDQRYWFADIYVYGLRMQRSGTR